MRYEPNDSPFGLTFANWDRLKGETLQRRFLEQFTDADLDEFAQIAASKATTPILEDDSRLGDFAHDCEQTLAERRRPS